MNADSRWTTQTFEASDEPVIAYALDDCTGPPYPVLAIAPGGGPIHSVQTIARCRNRVPGCEFVVYEGLPHNITDTAPRRCAEDLKR